MPIKIGDTTEVEEGISYLVSPEHRAGGNHSKSKWVISIDQEVNCFTESITNRWTSTKIGWGLIVATGIGNLTLLGHSPRMSRLFLAKFIDSNPWHGYPANIRENIYDRPKHAILMDWFNRRLIHKHQISRIKNGRI